MNVKYLINDGLIVTVDQERRIIERGSIAIEGSTIVDVGKTEVMVKKYSPRKVIDARNRIVLPGLIDSHVHLANEGPKGFIPDNIPAIPWITDSAAARTEASPSNCRKRKASAWATS